MDATTASLSELVAEMEKADIAIALGITPRKWRAYRRELLDEVKRRTPVDAETAAMSDADLLRALES